MLRFLPVLPVLTAAGALLALAGCGSSAGPGVKVHGVLVNNGKPITPPPNEDDSVEITLAPLTEDENRRAVVAVYQHTDGTFHFGGPTGGVAPGEYRVLLQYIPYQGNQDDRFGEQFTEENSTLKHTVTADPEQAIVIDVGKKIVTKQ